MDFDWDDIAKIFAYLVPVIAFVVFNVIFKKQQEQRRRVTVVKNLLSEIDYNQKLMESFFLGQQTKKFKTAIWDRNKDKIDYIEDKELYSTLVDAYDITDEFNHEIDMAKKYKSSSYLVGIKVDRLREPLNKSRQRLQEWLELNKGKKKVSTQTS